MQAFCWLEWVSRNIEVVVPKGLKRFQKSGQSHFVTFSCYGHRPLLTAAASKQTFEIALERVRRIFGFCVYGYVIMPDHVHVLIGEPEHLLLADALKSLKQGVSRRLIGKMDRFWEKRYFDFNVRNERQFTEKLGYMHRNPVKAGLCGRPEDWEWSSFRHYDVGRKGRVEIESAWTAGQRLYPLKPTEGLHGPPDNTQSQAPR